MKIVFDNADFTDSLSIGFKGRHQSPWITVVKEYRESTGEFIGADMIWYFDPIWAVRRWLKRARLALK